jgi:glycerol uptake facilitator-like aquaporin
MGTALLLAIVVGSGIMGERISAGNDALALLANSIATGCGLAVLISIFGPVSGAHFNPAVTLVAAAEGELGPREAAAYAAVQMFAAVAGVALAHLMFGLPVLQEGTKVRTGAAQWLAEGVATFGLVLTILGCVRQRLPAAPLLVAAYITAAYWFTASTSFANPAVTVARSFTDTFAGIRPSDIGGFIAAQLAGALAGWRIARAIWPAPGAKP